MALGLKVILKCIVVLYSKVKRGQLKKKIKGNCFLLSLVSVRSFLVIMFFLKL